MKKLLILLLVSNIAFAQNATLLDMGQKAPFSGTLILNDRVDQLVKAERSNIVLRDLGVANEDLIEYHREAARIARGKLSAAKFDSFLEKTGYFLMGCILTSVAFKIAAETKDL